MTGAGDGPELAVVAGLSGAGRTTAGDALEDLGWFVIDNLPPALIPRVAELSSGDYERVALVVGSAGPQQAEVLPALRELRRQSERLRIVFLDAATDELVLRYKVGRRRHPFSTGSLSEAVEQERAQLAGVKELADLVIDTTALNVHELRDRIVAAFSAPDQPGRLQTRVLSFGYKKGVPTDVDLVFDCRFLPNPHWVAELRPLTGRDEPVRDYVLDQGVSVQFLAQVRSLLALLLPHYVAEGKHYLTVAFGCTGGRHRSVAIAEETGRLLAELGVVAQVAHRDLDS
jgi:UPF0042 nucleotide-binding protein